MSNRAGNMYSSFADLDELWEKQDEKKVDEKKKEDKKSRTQQKKAESNDLKGAAFCAPRVQKKKNKRPIKGQSNPQAVSGQKKQAEKAEQRELAEEVPKEEVKPVATPTATTPVTPVTPVTPAVEEPPKTIPKATQQPTQGMKKETPAKAKKEMQAKPKQTLESPMVVQEKFVQIKESIYNQLTSQLVEMSSDIQQLKEEVKVRDEMISELRCMLSSIQKENALLRSKCTI